MERKEKYDEFNMQTNMTFTVDQVNVETYIFSSNKHFKRMMSYHKSTVDKEKFCWRATASYLSYCHQKEPNSSGRQLFGFFKSLISWILCMNHNIHNIDNPNEHKPIDRLSEVVYFSKTFCDEHPHRNHVGF